MKLYVVRHGHAGSRGAWVGDDRDRPLSSKGEKQALGIADSLESEPIARLVSSPSRRCVQTLEPLAERLGVAVEIDRRLDEGSDGVGALDLAQELRADGGGDAVICSHGDVIPDLLHVLATTGTRYRDALTWPKGSMWALRWKDGAFTDGRFMPPPG